MKTLEIISYVLLFIMSIVVIAKLLNIRNPFRKRFSRRYVTHYDLECLQSEVYDCVSKNDQRQYGQIKKLRKQIKKLKKS